MILYPESQVEAEAKSEVQVAIPVAVAVHAAQVVPPVTGPFPSSHKTHPVDKQTKQFSPHAVQTLSSKYSLVAQSEVVRVAEQLEDVAMKVYPVEQPDESHSPAVEQVSQLAAQATQAEEDIIYPVEQAEQTVAEEQVVQSEEQEVQPPAVFLKYPVLQPDAVQVVASVQVPQLAGQASQTLVVALLM